jgi:phospholipid transport system substrate-binding protein
MNPSWSPGVQAAGPTGETKDLVMTTITFRGLLGIAVASLILPATSLAGVAPQKVIEKATEDVRTVLKQKTKKGSKEEEAQKQQLKKVVDGFLDYNELARRSLGSHWLQRSALEKTDFTQLLRDLIEASYTNAIRNNVEFTMKYEGEKIDEEGSTASVTTMASAKNSKGKTISEDLLFHLFLKDGAWMVYDVEFGDVSLVRHYRSEFNRKIKKESYQALVEAMKKKLAEVREGKVNDKDLKKVQL